MTTRNENKKLALVLSGGGARGAYEAGIIHYIRTKLPPAAAKRPFDVLCGTSVGAINACFLASTNHDLEYQGRRAFEIWNQLQQSNIYRRDMGALYRFMLRRFQLIFRNLFSGKRTDEKGRQVKRSSFKGLFDTTPFPFYMRNIIHWKQIALNVQSGSPRALSITTTNVHTGKMELFIDRHPSVYYSGKMLAHFGHIEARHILASAAIPIIFPAVRIGRNYYCDGGLRLNTPMSPAIHLGADKVLVIGLHHVAEEAEQKRDEPFHAHDIFPTTGEIIGQVLKSLFLDRLDYDLNQLERINRIIKWGEEVYGDDYLDKVNSHLEKKGSKEDIAGRGLKKLEVMSIFPSIDMRKIFMKCIEEDPDFINHQMTMTEKMLFRMLDVDLKHGHDFLSFLFFTPAYIRKILELGFEDARAHHDELVGFFES